ncbi:MAG: hypothetical protein ACI3XQ_05640 [Eubacteriales bacterium]
MGKKTRRFADDGWAIWIDGDDRSTVYMNEWLNPKGKSWVDVGVRIYGAKGANELNIYVPFRINDYEIKDLSSEFEDRDIMRGIFNTNGIIDAEKNEYTSELKYDGRTVSLINLKKEILTVKQIASGSTVTANLKKIQDFITSDEAYVIFRIPHKTLDEIFMPKKDIGGSIERFKELITSPTVTKKYGYSIRINEARLLPVEINRIEVLNQQRIRKALVTISINEEYELNDSNCYRIRRLEEDLYKNYAPQGYDCSEAITYQWVEERDKNMKAHYNFYFDVEHRKISKSSMFLYFIIVLLTSILGSSIYDLIKYIVSLF